jgi:hypothetical protein
MGDDLFFVLVSQFGDPHGEEWRAEFVELDRATAEQQAELFQSAVVWIDREDITTSVATVTQVVSRDELVELVGPERAAAIEDSVSHQIEALRRRGPT